MKRPAAWLLAFFPLLGGLALAQPGSLDVTFNPGTGPDGSVSAICLQTNGQIVVAGGFHNFNGQPVKFIARLNSDGSLEGTFNPGASAGNINALALSVGGQIFIAGGFTSVDGLSRKGFARLRSDGSLDTSFIPQFAGGVQAMTVQNDGRILLAGQGFSDTNDQPVAPIARLNSDGTVDASFYPGTGPNDGNISGMALQANGQILVGGNFTNFSGVTQPYIARLNADGSLDQTFNPPASSTWVEGGVSLLLLTTNNQVIIGGGFQTIFGYTRLYIARLNADGSLDPSFTSPFSPNSPISTLAQQSDGTILYGGYNENGY